MVLYQRYPATHGIVRFSTGSNNHVRETPLQRVTFFTGLFVFTRLLTLSHHSLYCMIHAAKHGTLAGLFVPLILQRNS